MENQAILRKKLYSPEFRCFYRKEILKAIQNLQCLKTPSASKIILKFVLMIVLFVLLFFVLIIIDSLFEFNMNILLNIVLFIFPPCLLLKIFSDAYSNKFKIKSVIFTKILSFVGDFKYIYNSLSDRAQIAKKLVQSRIFAIKDSGYVDDHFSGTYKGLKINLYEIKIANNQISKLYSKEKKQQYLNFIYITMSCNKKFKGFTLVRSKSHYLDKGEQVKLEDINFNKYFSVKASNQIEARYLLTTAFIERLCKLRRRNIFKKIDILFENGEIHILIPSEKDWFEVANYVGKISETECKRLIFEILSLFEIIDILHLDKDVGL